MEDKMKEFVLRINNITNIDYAHFLAFHKGKCKNTHAHGSCMVSAEVGGTLNGQWVVDFGVVKGIIKDIVSQIDHKFVVKTDYVNKINLDDNKVIIKYDTVNGSHYMELPPSEVFVLGQDPTLENIIYYIAENTLTKLPENVTYVKIMAQEGIGGSAEVTVKKNVLV
jgi:6-pyruvoyl-tetrahydropterin synthase